MKLTSPEKVESLFPHKYIIKWRCKTQPAWKITRISSPWTEIKFLADCCWSERRRSKDSKYVRKGTEGMNENTNFSTIVKNLTELHRRTVSSEFCLHPRTNLASSLIEVNTQASAQFVSKLPVNPILGLAALIFFQSSTKFGYGIKGRHQRHILTPFQ
jgi:hypothetical protein